MVLKSKRYTSKGGLILLLLKKKNLKIRNQVLQRVVRVLEVESQHMIQLLNQT